MTPQIHKESIFKIVTTTIELPVTNEKNTYGYINKNIEIPEGYKWISTNFSANQIANNSGLQLTNVTKLPLASGKQIMWIEWFAPHTIGEKAKEITVTLLCVKEDLIN